jgi:hypothetical protein
LEHDEVHGAAGPSRAAGATVEFAKVADLTDDLLDNRAIIKAQEFRVGAGKSADVNGRGKAAPLAGFERPDVVRLDVGPVRRLVDAQAAALPFGTKFFSNRGHLGGN